MLAAVGKLMSTVGQLFGAKYYVTQQLAQMQAHYVNERYILRRAEISSNPRLLTIVQDIFAEYEKAIKKDEWCWVKQKGELFCIPMKDGKMTTKNVTICAEQRFDGIFPPIASLANVMKECTTRDIKPINWYKEWENSISAAVKGYGEGYLSNLEYNVLQLEALEQDIAIELPTSKVYNINNLKL